MSPERNWYLFINDMIGFIDKALQYCEGKSFDDFVSNDMTYDATLRNLELIGEAANKIPSHIRAKHAHVPWRELIGTRNRLIHGYLGIDDELLWNIVQLELPELRADLHDIYSQDNDTL